MVLDKVRIETKEDHQALEKLVIPQIKSIQSETDYVEVLKLFYGYFKPVEECIDKYLSDEIIPHFSTRRKSAAILNDIQSLQPGSTVKICTDVPVINSKEEAIGAMYVLEGSTLGGKIISEMIRKRLNIEEGSLSFFSGYKERSDEMWHLFINAMNDKVSDTHSDIVVETAKNTFIKFKHWIQEN